MGVNEQELRALVRDAVARHLGDSSSAPLASPPRQQHASHGVYVNLVNIGDACLIEPSVQCTHCEYCRSHGH
jgi:hypothetical protein